MGMLFRTLKSSTLKAAIRAKIRLIVQVNAATETKLETKLASFFNRTDAIEGVPPPQFPMLRDFERKWLAEVLHGWGI
jgi:hypothetical protein